MRKAVLYDSNTGNTEAMAYAIAEGAGSAGDEVYLTRADCADTERVLSCDILYLGCPAMGVEMVGDALTDFCRAVGRRFDGRKVALFGSYGRGTGQWIRAWASELNAFGAEFIEGSGLTSYFRPTDEILDKCRHLGMYRSDASTKSFGRKMEEKEKLLPMISNAIVRRDLVMAEDLLVKAKTLDPDDPNLYVRSIECIYCRNRGLFALYNPDAASGIREIYSQYGEYLRCTDKPRSLKDIISSFGTAADPHTGAVCLIKALREHERLLMLDAIRGCFHNKTSITAGRSSEYLMFWPDYRGKLQKFLNHHKFDFFRFDNSPFMAVAETADVILELKRCISSEAVWVRDETEYLMGQALKNQPVSRLAIRDRYAVMSAEQVRILSALDRNICRCLDTGSPAAISRDDLCKAIDVSEIYIRTGKFLGIIDRTKTVTLSISYLADKAESFFREESRRYLEMLSKILPCVMEYYEDFSDNSYKNHSVSIGDIYSRF